MNPSLYTLMASIRRFVLRKKRLCLLVLFCCLIFILLSSWFRTIQGHNPPIVLIDDVAVRVEPQFNVLEPPHVNINETSYSEKQESKVSELTLEVRRSTTAMYKPSDANTNGSLIISSGRNMSEDIEVAKNKTLMQMGVLGAQENAIAIPMVSFVKQIWNLSVSFDDIGNIMKDTSFLNKLKPLNLSGPMLVSSQNRTSNFSMSMPLKMGYCDCWERYCSCCVQLVSPQLHLSNKTCANFTFTSKTHELNMTFSIDSKPVYSGIISADAPPLLCLGSIPTVADMCVHFFNMTYKVDRLGLHKSQILGCTDMSLNIYNKTIAVFPVDCFQIPGDPNHHLKEDNIILPNFVP